MFHPYSVNGGTATLDPQVTGQNGQSRIPEMFNGYPQNITGSVPFNTIPTTPVTGYPTPTGYATPTTINPAYATPFGGVPFAAPTYCNPMMPFGIYNAMPTYNPSWNLAFNPAFNPTVPFGGYPIPQTAYPTPFVNAFNPFVNPVNPFVNGYNTVNPYVNGFNTVNPYVNGFNTVNPFVNGFSPVNPLATMFNTTIPTPVNTIPTSIVNTPYGPVCCPTPIQGFNPVTGVSPFRGGFPTGGFGNFPYPTGGLTTTPFGTTTPWNTGCEGTIGWNNPLATLNPLTAWQTGLNPFGGVTTPWNTIPTNFNTYGIRTTFGGYNTLNPFATGLNTTLGFGTSPINTTPWGGVNGWVNPFGGFGGYGSFSNSLFGYPTTTPNGALAATTINPLSGVTNPFFNPTNIAFGIPGVNGLVNPTTGLTNCGPICCN